jgi:Protein phosphatase 2C
MPKQDAWRGTAGRFGSLVVVADGLGSRPHGRLGAVAACRAAHRAVRELAMTGIPDPAELFPRVEEHWRRELGPREPTECGTTVLLSLVHTSGGVLLGQVGDGLIAVGAGATAEPLVPWRAGFGNETDALGVSGRPPVWHSRWLPSPPAGFRVFMATDGVADDLHPEHIGGFITELARQFGPLPAPERHRRLCAELRSWPTPGHFDDKTLALHWAKRSDDPCS